MERSSSMAISAFRKASGSASNSSAIWMATTSAHRRNDAIESLILHSCVRHWKTSRPGGRVPSRRPWPRSLPNTTFLVPRDERELRGTHDPEGGGGCRSRRLVDKAARLADLCTTLAGQD